MDLTRVCNTTTLTQTADFIFYKGITFRSKFLFKQNDGTPLVLDDYVIAFHIVDEDGVQVLLLDSLTQTSNGSRIIKTNSTLGESTILVTDEETALLDIANLSWWITIKSLDGDIFLRGKGKIQILNPY